LSTVKFISDRVAVMYLGKLVEVGPAKTVFAAPKHPYTRALIDAVPVPDPSTRNRRQPMKGEPPSPIAPPSGCRFHPRCPSAMPICSQTAPPFLVTTDGHRVACHLYSQESTAVVAAGGMVASSTGTPGAGLALRLTA